MNNNQIQNAKDKFEKLEYGIEDTIDSLISIGESGDLSGITMNPFVEQSSLMGGSGGKSLAQPNFVSDCFFLVHILISCLNFKKQE